MIRFLHRRNIPIIVILALLVVLISLSGLQSVNAVHIPPAGSLFNIQTSSPSRGLNIGDWYTNPLGGNGYHYFSLHVPCDWPSSTPIHVDLYHPDINNTPGMSGTVQVVIDEIPTLGTTVFEIYQPGTSLNPATNPIAPLPLATGSLQQTTYNPNTVGPNWTRFYTINSPV